MDNKYFTRTKENFDEAWMFHRGNIPVYRSIKSGFTGGFTDCMKYEEGKWLEIAFADKQQAGILHDDQWVEINLPHDYCVEGDYTNNTADWGMVLRGFLPLEKGCYQKEFALPKEDMGRKISLEFDGVMRNSTVYVNGHYIGQHFSGYTSFCYDITDVLRYGEEGRNVIFVMVDPTQSEGWWYEGSGIYRHTWLVKTSPLHVARYGTYVTTQKLTEESHEVRIQTTIFNEYNERKEFSLKSMLVDKNENIIAEVISQGSIEGLEKVESEQLVRVTDPELWCIENPCLYKIITQVFVLGEIVDTYETNFGIRTIEFTSDKGFFLNGKPTLIKGICNHQDFAGVGAALPDKLQEYKIKLLKEMGSNAYRCAHHMTTEILDLCDQVGMLVIAENRKLDCSPEGIEDLKELLYNGRNHPSVILWNMENEEILEGTVFGSRILKKLVEITHKIDKTRSTMVAANHGHNEHGYGDVVDVTGYNYGQNGGNQDIADHKRYPDRKIIGSECGSSVHTRGIYEVDEIKGYVDSYCKKLPSWCCSVEKAWTDLAEHPFLTGIFLWTGFDYRGEPTPYKWPCINSHFGLMDTCGIPKDWYYYCKAVWTKEPMVHIFPHWNWAGREGTDIEVWAFSNCEVVELFLNGKSMGEQTVIPNRHLEWTIQYLPGELKAVGRIKGENAATKLVATTGLPYKIKLIPDRSQIEPDGCDVSVVRVCVLDECDRVVPIADNQITFSIEGAGKIIGVGNGDPSSHEPDKASMRKVFNGYCIVIVQAGKEPGSIFLKATSPGLLSDNVSLDVKK